MSLKLSSIAIIFAALSISIFAQVPEVHSNIHQDKDGKLFIKIDTTIFYEKDRDSSLNLQRFQNGISGSENGLNFNFGEGFNGTLYFGFIHFDDSKHPMPVFFKSTSAIKNGLTHIDIKKKLSGSYDMVNWQETGEGTLGYRVANAKGLIVYDGMVSFTGKGPFEVDDTIISGPFVNLVTDRSAVISFETNNKITSEVNVAEQKFESAKKTKKHEIKISGLKPATKYSYTVNYGKNHQTYSFSTAPESGSRTKFTFSYASDSRAGQGGGERNLFGTNFYTMRKIMALNASRNVAFMQFSGDMIDGYKSSRGVMDLQYANWKKSIEPFAHYFPVYISMGNHEAFTRYFDNGTSYGISVDRFPYASESAEKVFADNFVNPVNGPVSEDGSKYDPNPEKMDFPSYDENVFYYTYDNVAVIVMNSDYWYSPSSRLIPQISGGLHGYIMDNQLEWFKKTVKKFEDDNNIDHIFITEHTPFFPNGGHKKDDMWYNGNNEKRPYVAGKPVDFGIIERRDHLLDVIVNNSKKTVAILTGDEHNYCRLEVGPQTEIYPEDYPEDKKIKLTRTIWQVNNGAAGAPYYAQQKLPWSQFLKGFTTQNALVFFNIEGTKIEMEVYNPDTLEKFDHLELRK
ncbi:MAG: metallophosphoesterase family protein [Calditrichaeota bacterium]|nr:MAG: hypothetical protein DWQ03_19550 [Calditrichota bacterium]MBL1205117.1 metallophosphoesterase family protein [Calditrichota bacterium]NOG44947.1 metallophosphoesterase family protein [Calditrichota bacterium]